ncbi:MAG: hypothetical protein JJU12_02145 [Chlamydiales bacterium]|nr:hypothetical protein [Chlamydiales bacterium]
MSNWVSPQKINSVKRPKPLQTMESLNRFFQLFLPRLQVKCEWHFSNAKKYTSKNPSSLKPDILLLVDIDAEESLDSNFKALRKADAIADQTLVGWTRNSLAKNREPTAFVKPARLIHDIKQSF